MTKKRMTMVLVIVSLKSNPLAVTAFLILLAVLILMAPAGAATIPISPGTGAIQAAVSHAQSDDTIVLSPGTYRENGITITGKSLTFTAADGQGPSDTVIDAQSAGRIINVTDTSSLTVTRLGFKNAVADAPGGGAINAPGAVTVTGSTFTNCSAAPDGGGAIKAGTLTLAGSTFTDCSTPYPGGYGGAVWANGTLIVTDSTFTNCSHGSGGMAFGDGGALFSLYGDISVTGSVFSNCSAVNGYGGAIASWHDSTVTVTSSTFTGCSAADAGAVFTEGEMRVTGSVFTSCSVDRYGGALSAMGNITVMQSAFTDCSAKTGGALASFDMNATVDSSTFTNCRSTHIGGAVYAPDSVTVTGSTIENTTSSYGGAMYSGRVTVGTSTITNSFADYDGGAVWANGAVVDTSTFTDCSAGSTSSGFLGHGGAIAGMSSVEVLSSTFTNCSVTGLDDNSGQGGALFSTAVTVTNATFANCSAAGPGHSGGSGGAVRAETSVSVTGATFTGCSARDGGAVASPSGTLHFSRLVDSNAGKTVSGSGTGIDAENNWWGSNADPSGYTNGTVTTSPWLVLGISASPFSGGPTTPVRANLTWNMNTLGSSTNTSTLGHLPDEIPVTFTLTGISGTFNPVTGSTASGVSTTTFAPTSGGLGTVTARVDNQEVSVPITIITVFTGTPASGTAPLTVAFSDTSGFSPVMWNWSFGDGNWSNTTDAAAKNPTHTYATIGTYTVSLITSGGYGTDTFSRPGYISVTAPGTPESSSGDSGRSTSFVVTSPGTAAGGTMTFGIGQPLSAGGVDYTYAITTVAIVPSETLGSTDLIVTDAGATSHPPDGQTTAGIVVISPVAVNPSSIGSGTIAFAVSKSWLTDHGLTPADIVLMRYHDGVWAELPTTYQDEAGGACYFTATTPGFSYFAIAARTGTASANATVTEPAAASVPVSTTLVAAMTSAIPAYVKAASAGTSAPVTTATIAVPAGATGSSGFPVMTVALIGAGCVVLVGAGWWVRRWWIWRQNPALFRKYD